MHELVDQLIQFHRHKAALITEIEVLLPQVENDDALARAELKVYFESFRGEPEKAHHHNEELILRELRQVQRPLHARIERTAEEHVVFSQLVARLCAEIDGSIDEPAIVVANVKWFLGQYDDHASNEEAILFPAANKNISQKGWQRIGADWSHLRQ